MTISSTTRKAGPFDGNDVTTSFPFTFKVFSAGDITVVRTMSSGIEETLVLNSAYSVALNGDQDANPGGTITYPISGDPLPTGWRLTAIGTLDNLQPTDITNGGGFYPQVIENALDRVTMLIQQLEEELGRTIRIAVSDDVTDGLDLPATSARADKVLGFDSEGSFRLYGTSVSVTATLYRKFTPTAGQTEFPLPQAYTPGANALYVFRNGSKLVSGVDFTETSTTSFTLTSGAAGTDVIEALAGVPQADLPSTDAGLVRYTPKGTGAVSRTAQSKMQDVVSVKDFGAVGDGSDEFDKILAAWEYCLANGKDLYFPAGKYSSGVKNMPFKNPVYPATTLLDCGNITIFGDGPATVLRSDSATGADVLNLYSVKNLHVRNLSVTASLSGTTGSGSNGCSIVGGFDNVTVDGLWVNNLPYVDKGTYLDGGKAFTIQPGTPDTECGTAKATRIYAKGCVYGADVTVDLVNWSGKKHAVDIDIIAEDCFAAMVFSAGAATAALSEGITTGVRARVHGINCQYDAKINRAHGIELDMMVTTNKSAAARRLNPQGVAWHSGDAIVTALHCYYAKNSQIRVVGDKGGCDYGVRIGGTTAGSSGMTGATEFCDIFLDFGNQSTSADFDLIDSGGNTIANSRLQISTATAATLPVGLYSAANDNNVVHGHTGRLINPKVAKKLTLALADDGTTETGIIDSFGSVTGLQGKHTGTAGAVVAGLYDSGGTFRLGIRNGNGIVVDVLGTSAAAGAYVGKQPVYNSSGTLLGYFPIYE